VIDLSEREALEIYSEAMERSSKELGCDPAYYGDQGHEVLEKHLMQVCSESGCRYEDFLSFKKSLAIEEENEGEKMEERFIVIEEVTGKGVYFSIKLDEEAVLKAIKNLPDNEKIRKVFKVTEKGGIEEYELKVEGFEIDLVRKDCVKLGNINFE
jgi:hypothetical protein